MTEAQAPTWEEESTVGILGPDGTPWRYNLQPVGPTTWLNLRQTKLEDGFEFPFASGLVPLVWSATHPENWGKGSTNKVRGRWLAGNTLLLLGREGIYGVDFPTVRKGEIQMSERTLKRKLGKREDNGVFWSDDGRVRFTGGYDHQTNDIGASKVVAVAYDGFQNAELLAQGASHYRLQPILYCASEAPEKAQIKVPGVFALVNRDDRLDVDCDYSPDAGDWYSFRVRAEGAKKLAEPVRPKK